MLTKQLWPCLLLVSSAFYQLILTDNVTHADDSSNSGVCKRVKGSGKGDKKSLLCVGKMRSTLLIITRDFHFYQIPMTTVNGTIDKLYLGNYPAKAIKDAWPKLWAYKPFQALVANPSRILDAYTITDSIDEYVLFETTKANMQYCTLYGINKQYVSHGTYYDHSDRDLCLLSSDKMNNYYQLTRNSEYMAGNLTIMRWVWSGDNIKDVVEQNDKPGERTANPQHKDFWRMCADGSNKIRVESNAKAQCKSVDWPVLTGFQANGQFYLFGTNYIFTFPEAAYNKPGSPVGLKTTSYDSFIQCGGKVDARDLQASKKSPIRFGLIVAIILILVILLLCCLLCLIREALARKKKKDKERKKGSKPAPIGRRRSSGLSGFGSLKRKRSNGSKRSKGSPSQGRLLTKKPSGSNKVGTRRSLGTGAAGVPLTRGGLPSKRSAGSGVPGASLTRQGLSGTRRSSGSKARGASLTRQGLSGTRRSSGSNARGASLTRPGIPGTKRSAGSNARGAMLTRQGRSNHATARSNTKK